MYATTPLIESASMLIIKRPSGTVLPNTRIIKTGSATFFEHPYSQPHPPVPNLVYGSDVEHPTETVVAYNDAVPIYMDQVTAIGHNDSVPGVSLYAKVPENTLHAKEWIKRGFAAHGEGHMFGYGTCMWLRHCDPAVEMMGSACSATLSNVVYNGFCFISDTGSLECGRLSAADDEYGEHPTSLDVAVSPNVLPSVAGFVDVEHGAPSTTFVASTPGQSGTAYRCPTGSPAKSLGSFVSKRPLSGGCMITSDASYDPFAEIHVPSYCTTPLNHRLGCMLPAALNFDPAAKQPGFCKFPTEGCTSPTAFNYNSLATVSDGSCIEAIDGCTVAATPYAGVEAGTPMYKSGFYGAAGAGSAGGWPYLKVFSSVYTGRAVTNYNSAANNNTGCIVAVEGCMDSTAVNYDSKATINSYTWCVPAVSGCMVPNEAYAASSYSTTQNQSSIFGATIDRPTTAFAITTTVHDRLSCLVGRHGCTDSNATNYDPLATMNGNCWYHQRGCLNPAAVNFGCPDTTYSGPCTGLANPVTRHWARLCKWSNIASPPPPSPPVPPSGTYSTRYESKLTFALETKTSTPAELEADLKSWFRVGLSMGDEFEYLTDADYSYTARRRLQATVGTAVEVTLSQTFDTSADADTASTNLGSSIGDTPQSVTASMAGIDGLAGVTALDAPLIETRTVYVASSAAAETNTAAIIGGIVGGVVGLILLCAILYFLGKRKGAGKQTYPA